MTEGEKTRFFRGGIERPPLIEMPSALEMEFSTRSPRFFKISLTYRDKNLILKIRIILIPNCTVLG